MSEPARIPKPNLRGMLKNQIKIHIVTAFVAAFIACSAFKVLHNDRRKKKYAEFYKNYDIDKAFNDMRSKGLFQSCDGH